MDYIKRAWNQRVSETTAHIKIDKWLKSYDQFINNYEEKVLKEVSFKNKSIIDYGIGGGWVTKHLFENRGLKKAVCYDIAERSIEAAKKNLKDYNTEFILIDSIPDFKDADIFLSLAVIQHFPTIEYSKEFFKKLNDSKIKKLVFSYRDGKKTEFEKNTYKTPHEISNANKMNLQFIQDLLTNYSLKYQSGPDAVNQNYVIFDLRK